MGKDPTLTGRTETWKILLSQPINPWVGTGFESFWLGDRLRKIWDMKFYENFYINEAHNGYIEVYLNLGLVGASLMCLLLLTGYRRSSPRSVGSRSKAPYCSVSFWLYCSRAWTEAAFRMLYPSWFFLLLATIAASQVVALEAVEQPGNESAECGQWIGAESVARTWEWTDESELRIYPH